MIKYCHCVFSMHHASVLRLSVFGKAEMKGSIELIQTTSSNCRLIGQGLSSPDL